MAVDPEVKNFDSPDETRPFEGKGEAHILNIGGTVVGRGFSSPVGSGATT